MGQRRIGATDKKNSFELLDACYYKAGGNFIDTGNNYQDTTSEQFIGERMESRCNCDKMVVATQSVNIAYVFQKTPHVFPVSGGRKVVHLHLNIGALNVTLSEDYVKQIESLLPFEHGFPYNLFAQEEDEGANPIMFMGGHFDRWPLRYPEEVTQC
ncbi:unnamed protein product [Peniophora sp. CBMAI 1063]|nr:unnamed protein product [Peniophora sp. CBMAI 1063]